MTVERLRDNLEGTLCVSWLLQTIDFHVFRVSLMLLWVIVYLGVSQHIWFLIKPLLLSQGWRWWLICFNKFFLRHLLHETLGQIWDILRLNCHAFLALFDFILTYFFDQDDLFCEIWGAEETFLAGLLLIRSLLREGAFHVHHDAVSLRAMQTICALNNPMIGKSGAFCRQ